MPSIKFDMNDVKPLLGSLGLGGDGPKPDAPPPIPFVAPPPPGPPPPTPAAAGFGPWLADPQNRQKVSEGITPPNTPLMPAPTPPAAMAPAPAAPQMASMNPPLPTSAPTPAEAYQTKVNMDMTANPDQYQHAQLMGRGWGNTLAQGGVAALMGLSGGLRPGGDPLAGVNYIQGLRAHDENLPQANAATYDIRNVKPLRDAAQAAQSAAQLEDTQSQSAQRTSDSNMKDQRTGDMTPFVMSPAQAAAINHPELSGTTATMRDYSRLVGMAGNNNTSAGNNARTNDTSDSNNQNTNATKLQTNADTNKVRQSIAAEANKTKALVASMHDSTSRANNADTNSAKGGGTSAQGFKVPADVTKRAALASNVLENSDAVEALTKSRPDMLGSIGGRYTNVQQMVGSDDAGIHEMGVRMHNIALASNGAHGVRSQQAIQKTEDELFNNFKSGPTGIAGSLKATRGSMQTFLNDENNFSTTGRRMGGTMPSAPNAPTGSHQVGDSISIRGKQMKITAVHPDGSFDAN